jgi:hypothetical protein
VAHKEDATASAMMGANGHVGRWRTGAGGEGPLAFLGLDQHMPRPRAGGSRNTGEFHIARSSGPQRGGHEPKLTTGPILSMFLFCSSAELLTPHTQSGQFVGGTQSPAF